MNTHSPVRRIHQAHSVTTINSLPMKSLPSKWIIGVVSLLCFSIASVDTLNSSEPASPLINEKESGSSEAFDLVMSVVTHPRCMNCHPRDNHPRQGDDSHTHYFNVQRGEKNHGAGIAKCETCHQNENNNSSGVPGAPHWGLAPKSMGWIGLSKTEIAEVILDTAKNGGRSHEQIEKHLTEDPLVLWAFEPGVNNEGIPRQTPPISREQFIEAVKTWIGEGAHIPSN